MSTIGQPPEEPAGLPDDGTSVVDAKVLAERRARRAELAEESLQSRASSAEHDRMMLATRLAEAEHALDRARRDRDALQDDLTRRERALRAAEQREFAEQRRRVELEDEAVQERRALQDELDGLRRRLAAAVERTDELTRELASARRAADEATQLTASAAEVKQLQRRAAEAVHDLDERRAALEAEVARLQRSVETSAPPQDSDAQREAHLAEITLLQIELDRRIAERDAAREQAREALAARDELEQELLRRKVLEGQARDALVALRARVEEAEAEQTERAQRDAAVETLIVELVDTANDLRAGYEQQLQQQEQALQEAFDRQLEDALRAAREEGADGRAELTRRLAEVEARLAAERARVRDAEQLAVELERRLSEDPPVSDAEPDLAPPPDPAPPPDRGPSAAPSLTVPAVTTRPQGDVDPETSELISGLQRAAERLRARVDTLDAPPPDEVPSAADEMPGAADETPRAADEQARTDEAATGEPSADMGRANDPVLEDPAVQEPIPPSLPPRERSWAVQQAAAAMGDAFATQPTTEPDAVVLARVPRPVPPMPAGPAEPPRATSSPDPQGDVQVLEARSTADGPGRPWVAAALARAADGGGERLDATLAAVFRAQASRTQHDLDYDLRIDGLGAWRVSLRDGMATSHRLDAGLGGDVDVAVSGTLDQVAPLLQGGAARRLAGARVSGRRRRLRRVLRDLRAPLGVAELAAAGADAGLLLELLCAAVPTEHVAGHDFTVAYALDGADDARWHVRADRALRVGAGAPVDANASTVHVSSEALPGLLEGRGLPPGERVTVTGAVSPVALLHRWFDAARGVAS